MGFNRNDWRLFAWFWMIAMTCLGIGVLAAPFLLPPESDWIRKGAGTALLLVAASILFVAVFEGKGMLVKVAGALTAIFGYTGTIRVLESENPLLLAIIITVTLYVLWAGMFLVLMAWMRRNVFGGRP